MHQTSAQRTSGSSPVVIVAAWLFILIVTIPIGCCVLFLAGFWLIMVLSQLPDSLREAFLVLVVLLGLLTQVVVLSKIVRGFLRKRSQNPAPGTCRGS